MQREYQREGTAILIAKQRHILADSMGIGKTKQALQAMQATGRTWLVVAPKSIIGVWKDIEVPLWAPEFTVFAFRGSPSKRAKLLQEFMNFQEPKILVTTYHPKILGELLKGSFDGIVTDEGHRLRGRKTQTYKVLHILTGRTQFYFELTGTPIVKHPVDLIPQIQLLHPKAYRSYWRLVYEHFNIIQGVFGQIIGEVKSPEKFRTWCSQYITRRTKKEALPDLPPLTRRILPIDPTEVQERLYAELETKLLAELGDGRIVLSQNILVKIIKLRQVLLHPYLIGLRNDDSDISASETALIETVQECLDHEKPLVIFCPFTRALEHLWECLHALKIRSVIVKGGSGHESGGDAFTASRLFQEGKVDVCLCSIGTSEGFSLARSSEGVFWGCDWNGSVNNQAESRLHRSGVSESVRISYLIHPGKVDQTVVERAMAKAASSREIFPTDILRPDKERLLELNRLCSKNIDT